MVKSQEEKQTTPVNLPTHLGFIVDGNRRWARERGLPTLEGHRRGMNIAEDIAEAVINAGVKFVSFYIFSVENWNRSQEEVDYLMELELHSVKRVAKRLQKNNVRCVILGSPDCPRPDVFESLKQIEADTAGNTKGTVCFCFNYGGRHELAEAASAIVAERLKSGDASPVTVTELDQHIYHPEVPPVDMIIRTSGEQRISSFMLWRAAYSEFMFIDKYFPELDTSVVDKILQEYSHRHRRFGK